MPTRKVNPTSAGRRNMTMNDFSDITTDRPEKSLLKPLLRRAGLSEHDFDGRQHRIIKLSPSPERAVFGVLCLAKLVQPRHRLLDIGCILDAVALEKVVGLVGGSFHRY